MIMGEEYSEGIGFDYRLVRMLEDDYCPWSLQLPDFVFPKLAIEKHMNH